MNEILTFGNWLKQRRKALDLTQEQLADRVSCSHETIRKIEAGTRRPSRQMVETLSQRLAVPPEERLALVEFARAGSGVGSGSGSGSSPTEYAPEYRKELHPRPAGPTSNLPRPLTTFVGRHKVMEALRSLLWRVDVRLLTLTGAGGSGKTRLAIEVANEVCQDFQDGVFFVSLAPIADHNLVAASIARTLGIRETPGQMLIESIKSYLSNKQMLLVLDNFEQVLEAAPLVTELLSDAANLKVLVTSRETLHLYGEHNFPVPPLQLPEPENARNQSLELDGLYEYEAINLFVQRAMLVKPDFVLTNDNASAVSQICQRLDGLPLAIELAAARFNVLTPEVMLSRMGNRLNLLTRGPQDAPSRQQTLRNTIEWSYSLLDDAERTLFRSLAVFGGGWTFEAAQAICAPHDTRENPGADMDVLDALASLIDKSLVRQREGARARAGAGAGAEPRFWMLETIHEYAREKLREHREAEPVQREHALYFMKLAEQAEPHLTGALQQDWQEKLEEEHDNLRSALNWARAHSERGNREAAETGLRLAGALWRFWWVRGYLNEGRERLEGMLSWRDMAVGTPSGTSGSIPETLREAMAKALHGGAVLAVWQGDITIAQSRLEESVAMYRELGDRRGIAYVLGLLGDNATDQGDASKARSLYDEALTLSKDLGDKLGIAWALRGLAGLALDQGDFTSARALHEESMAMYQDAGYKRGIAASLTSLAHVAIEQRDYATARALLEKSMVIARELADKTGIVAKVVSIGIVEMLEGKYDSARSFLEEGLALYRDLGDAGGVAYSLCDLGNVAVLEGDHLAARAFFEECLKMDRKLGNSRERIIGCLAGLGGASAGIGDGEKGAKLLGASDALRDAFGIRLWEDARRVRELGVTLVCALMGRKEFERACQEGRAMSIEEATEYALGES